MVKEKKVYTISDGRQFKTKRSAERNENQLTMENAGYSKKEVDKLVEEIKDNHRIVHILYNDKEDWRDWPMHLVEDLPRVFDEHKKGIVKHQLIRPKGFFTDEKALKTAKAPKTEIPEEFEEYVKELNEKAKDTTGSTYELEVHSESDNLVKYVVVEHPLSPEEKMVKGMKLKDEDFRELLFERETAHEISGERGRWTQSVTTVVKGLDGNLYAVNWERGLTENQEDSFWNQPRKVKIEEKEVVKIVKEIVYLDEDGKNE